MNKPGFRSRHPILLIFWSLGLFVLAHTTQYVYLLLAARVTGAGFGDLAGGAIRTEQTLLIQGLVALLLGIPVTLLISRFLWRRSADWLRLHFSASLLLQGLALGLIGALAVMLLLAISGHATLVGFPTRKSAGQLCALLVGHLGWSFFTAILEELVFRGMVTRELAVRGGWPLATVYGGLVFAGLHLPAILSILTPLLVLGIVLAAVTANILFVSLYIRCRSLWSPIGFHAGWNFALAAILGTTMSGKEQSLALYAFQLRGDPLLTGGDFGIELSLPALALFLLTAVLFLRLRRRQGRSLLPPRPPLEV